MHASTDGKGPDPYVAKGKGEVSGHAFGPGQPAAQKVHLLQRELPFVAASAVTRPTRAHHLHVTAAVSFSYFVTKTMDMRHFKNVSFVSLAYWQ